MKRTTITIDKNVKEAFDKIKAKNGMNCDEAMLLLLSLYERLEPSSGVVKTEQPKPVVKTEMQKEELGDQAALEEYRQAYLKYGEGMLEKEKVTEEPVKQDVPSQPKVKPIVVPKKTIWADGPHAQPVQEASQSRASKIIGDCAESFERPEKKRDLKPGEAYALLCKTADELNNR